MRYYISSNLSAFPIYRNPSRASVSRYGIACDVENASALAALVDLLDENRTTLTPDGEVQIGSAERDTERLELRLARIGQVCFDAGSTLCGTADAPSRAWRFPTCFAPRTFCLA